MDLPSSFKQHSVWSLDHHSSSHTVLQHTSVAQVETLVEPPNVALPKSCGLKPKKRRTGPLNIRINESEKRTLDFRAKQAELTLHAFVKCVLLGSGYDYKLRTQLLMLNRELTVQGRNLNQIAKHVNSGTATPSQSVDMLDAIRVPLGRALYAVRNALTPSGPQP
jgi:predicted HicB family RNase H-like nuclease